MQAPKWSPFTGLALTIGLACILTVGLLWWAGGRASETGSAVQALVHRVKLSTQPLAWTLPLQSYVTTVDDEGGVWSVTEGVTVTFPAGAVGGEAVFTFTQELSDTLPAPSFAVPYFFDIRGTWTQDSGRIVGLTGSIYVDVEYDPSSLNGVVEGSLHPYYGGLDGSSWGPPSPFESFGGDARGNVLYFEIRNLGHWGVGGYRHQAFLPVAPQSSE